MRTYYLFVFQNSFAAPCKVCTGRLGSKHTADHEHRTVLAECQGPLPVTPSVRFNYIINVKVSENHSP